MDSLPSSPSSPSSGSLAEEIANAVTHGLGLLLSLGGLAVLVTAAAGRGDAWHLTGALVFGAALVLLYAASTLYHALAPGRAKRAFRRMDHAAIYLLIAGSYTPFALVALRDSFGMGLLAVVWSLALVGIVLEAVVPHRMRHASVLLYLTMGWLAVVAMKPLLLALSAHGLALLVAGGAAYTLGVVFYAWERLPWNHVVWHLFVLAGSSLHFSCVLGYVLPAA